MTIPSNPDSIDADFVVWGKQSYTNHRMYNIRTVNTSEDYVIGYPSLTSEGETENTPSNANMVSPNFCVASQLGETSYQSVLNRAVEVGYLMPSDGEFYNIAKEQCREYVETTYKSGQHCGHSYLVEDVINEMLVKKKTNAILFNAIRNMDKDDILRCAKRNNEKPFGYVIDYLKDVYFLPKLIGCDIAYKILEYFEIDNECFS